MSTADEIVTISPSCADDLMGLANRPIQVIHNGFDEEDFKDASPALDSDFTIVHIGSMNKDRNPRVLWDVLGHLVQNNPVFGHFIKIELVGIVDGSIIDSIQKAGLKDQLTVIGQQNHKSVIQRMRSAQLLLLPINDIPQQKGVMPGKMYEYLGAARPILAFGLPDSDTGKLLHDTGAGTLFGYNDKKGLNEFMEKAINSYQSGRLEVSSQGYLGYSRKNLAYKYSELLHKMLS
ncbi:MAG: glycosyltransferase [Saprospiraceae bacterium]|nr:glycosyltransferase [Saprospiraceae bacterium]